MDWLELILGFVAGLGTGWSLKVMVTNRSKRSARFTNVTQRNNVAGGDVVGGDKTDRT
jgi:hypothetical protein